MQQNTEATGSAEVKLKRAERYESIAARLESYDKHFVASLCLAMLVPLQDKQVDDLFNQLEKIIEEENVISP